MAFDESYRVYIEEQLSEFGDYTSKKMFGGVGFFKDKIMFAGIMSNVFRMKADETTIPDFEAHGMGPWQHGDSKPMPYYEVPQGVLEDKLELKNWANKAFVVACKSKKKK